MNDLGQPRIHKQGLNRPEFLVGSLKGMRFSASQGHLGAIPHLFQAFIKGRRHTMIGWVLLLLNQESVSITLHTGDLNPLQLAQRDF